MEGGSLTTDAVRRPRSSVPVIVLFDVDGVLIHNRAYRAALRQTVAYFSRRMGLGDLAPTEQDIEVYEAQSITVEWDSSAIGVAALLVERLRAAPARPLAPDFWTALDQLAARPAAIERPDFSALARRVGEATPPGGLPARAALALFLSDLGARAQEAAPLLHHLLADAYDIDRSPAMQVFQNYVLGHQRYAHYYGLPPRVETQALLETLDQPLLDPDLRDQMLARRAAGDLHPVIYTARPSLPPGEITTPARGYTPEAEIARRLVGLDPVPVMGFGKVDWLARRAGLTGADLVKPAPAQTIAAIAAARSGLEVESLKAALAVVRGDHLRYPLTACAGQVVHVFEDSASSLRAVARGVGLLNRQGLNLRLVRHGVASLGSPKHAALRPAADVVHADVNEGLAGILSV